MTVTLKLKPEVEAWLKQSARAVEVKEWMWTRWDRSRGG
jgi:hypothetical protein